MLAEATLFTYGTTRATNAIVERKVAKTALLVTEGFPEILVLKEGGRFDPHKWDFDYPKPYIPRRYTFEVPERITSEGTVDRPLDETAVHAIIDQIAAREFEAVAVCLLWSWPTRCTSDASVSCRRSGCRTCLSRSPTGSTRSCASTAAPPPPPSTRRSPR